MKPLLEERGAGGVVARLTQPVLRQVSQLLEGVIGRPGVFDNQPPHIHVANGVVELDGTPRLRPFRKEDFDRNGTDIVFDPAAKCPRFLDDLLRRAFSEADISLLQRYGGQCLIGRNLSQQIICVRGTPAGGKTCVVKVLERVVGLHNVANLRTSQLGGRFELAAFVGKRVLAAKDVAGDFLNTPGAAVLKALVGGDRLEGELKGNNRRISMVGDFCVLVTSNTRLQVRLDSDRAAWRRRLLFIDCEAPPVERPIADFDAILIRDEGPGILNWFIEGAVQLLAELRSTGRLSLTEEQQGRIDRLLNESDSVRSFVEREVMSSPGSNVTVHELQIAYSRMCEQEDWQAVTVRQFENAIVNIMLERHRAPRRTDIDRGGRNQRGFSGVALRAAAEE